jgi:DNA repair protein RadC
VSALAALSARSGARTRVATVRADGTGIRRIRDLPDADRPRDRLSTVGAQHLADRELLAMVLGTGTRGMGAHVLAEQILARYGSVLELARAHPADLLRVPGIGMAKATAVVAAFELARRADRPADKPVLTSTSDLLAVVKPLLTGRTRERLVLVTCDAMHKVISCEVLTEGSAERAIVPVRDILVAVLRRDGEAFALAHNHPGGDPKPTESDIEATLRVQTAATAAGLRLLDHIVVSEGRWDRVPMPDGTWSRAARTAERQSRGRRARERGGHHDDHHLPTVALHLDR